MNQAKWIAEQRRVQKSDPRVMTSIGTPQMPGFVESLRMLAEGQQYCLTDVAMMFGTSRERMRQLAVRYGVEQRGRNRGEHTRIWDDTLNQFRPVRSVEYRRIMPRPRRLSRKTRLPTITLTEQRKYRDERRAYMVAALRDLRGRIGAMASICEMYEAVTGRHATKKEGQGSAAGTLIGMWGGSKSLADIRAAAGLIPRKRGGAGHMRHA